jgi:GAF domain-containing protein
MCGAQPGSLTETHQQLALAIAKQLGLTLTNLALRETLGAQSVRDPLTGLFNRRYLEVSLERGQVMVADVDPALQ